MNSSLRARLAAESWKRLWPDGKPTGRPGKNGSKNILVFEDFAKQSFKVSETYAKQALAILNYSPELLDDAKSDLAGVYKTYQARVAEDRTKRQNAKFLLHLARAREAGRKKTSLVLGSFSCTSHARARPDSIALLLSI